MSNYYDLSSWFSPLRKFPFLDISREECLAANLAWDQWRGECLRRFAIWSTRGHKTEVQASDNKLQEVTADVQQVLESRVVPTLDELGHKPPGEWDGFLFYVVPSLSVVVICICIAICAYFLVEHCHKRKSTRTTTSPTTSGAPSAPHLLLTLSGGAPSPIYAREESILSNVSLPPPYSATASDGASSSGLNYAAGYARAHHQRHFEKGTLRSVVSVGHTVDPPPSYEKVMRFHR